MSNQNKRLKKFNRDVSLYAKHPLFNKVRELYSNDKINRIDSVIKILKSIKYTKKGVLFKTSEQKYNKFLNTYDEAAAAKKMIKDTLQKTQTTTVYKNEFDEILTNYGKYPEYKLWLHDYLINRMMKKNRGSVIVHKLEFYDEKENKLDSIEVYGDGQYARKHIVNTNDYKYIFTEYKTRKQLYTYLEYKITGGGSEMNPIIKRFLSDYNIGSYVKIKTQAYSRLSNIDNQSYLLQKYAENTAGDCVYAGLVDYFERYKDSKDKCGKAVYNKLINNPDKYAKPYTEAKLIELGKEFKISFNIIDLINKKDRKINEDKFNKYSVNFINSRYNHLDLLKSESKVDEVSTDDYNKIKSRSEFYVEKMGTLYTLNGNYKIDTQYKQLSKHWKDLYKINSCKIDIDSDAYKFINNYDDKVHRFFNNKMEIDNNLYNELDLKKAYYNYDKGTYYNGLPSGSYMSINGEGFSNDLFNKQYNNGLVGWYEIIINTDNNKLNYLGLKKDTKHLLFSSQIKLLVDHGIELIYLNYCICPAFHAPFDRDLKGDEESSEYLKTSFLKYIDGDKLVDKKPEHEDTTKAFCKIVGEMMIDSTTFSIDIKPSEQDTDFYKTLMTPENVFIVDGVFKIVKNIETPRSLKHLALAIHAYSSTIILEQILKFDIIEDVVGVKLDSIVYKKEANINYNTELFSDPEPSNIEKMINKQQIRQEQLLKKELINELNNAFKYTRINRERIQKLNDIKNEMIANPPTILSDVIYFNYICDTIKNNKPINIIIKYIKSINQDEFNNGCEIIRHDGKPLAALDHLEMDGYIKPYFIESENILKFDKSFCGEHITNPIIFLGGAGGTGKTHSILTSKNFNQNRLVFTSSCWDLIQAKQEEFNKILGLSLPKITGEMNGKAVEKYNIDNYNYLVDDELTLQDKKIVGNIITSNSRKFIILMGDIDYDGVYYQCSITDRIVKPKNIKNCQYIKYTKTYRFNNELNNKIKRLRKYMTFKNNINQYNIYEYVKFEFATCFKSIDDVIINPEDIGISCLKNIYDKNGECQFSKKFYENGSPKQYYIKDTKVRQGVYKGRKLEEEPNNKNYVCSLFRSIHSYQGRQLTQDNKIVILLNSLFDKNLLYTAISRARRLDQIIIIDMLGTKKPTANYRQFTQEPQQKKQKITISEPVAEPMEDDINTDDCEFID